ncbi:alpha-keto acid decarboxylase family protein [Flammeovirga pectinis]|uniref:Alpha-keto acid decarboxylase family protein n=1 Tax=Flammeovirga pectinis TaxID=2494373 RepID=A0A3S9P7X0_9BACT|nr:thiamine pyrophosphate-binding protein [Flammeovirga pectinis]AZQ64277.1 alpha-keto acid decarboxylase family protein [Flammeovirga pectinis]
MTVSEFLLGRLNELNVNNLFGIPGDYVLPFFDELIDKKTGVSHVNSRNELNATYSADGYSRINGFGAVAVTFGVGSLSTVNAVAGAYADNSPLVVICGAPVRSVSKTIGTKLLHHLVDQDFDTSMKVMENITLRTLRVSSTETAAAEIDALLIDSFIQKKPVYLEIPFDLQQAELDNYPTTPLNINKKVTNTVTLNNAVDQITKLIDKSESISSLVGPLLQRNNMILTTDKVISHINACVGTVFTGKISHFEDHPNAVGFYQGKVSEDYTNKMIENADLNITFGVQHTEFDTGVFSDSIGVNQDAVHILNDCVIINGEYYFDVYLKDILPVLAEKVQVLTPKKLEIDASARKFVFERRDKFAPTDNDLTIDRMYVQFANFMNSGDILVGDTGGYINASQAGLKKDIQIHGCGNWGSLGAGFGMSIGATFAHSEDSTDNGQVISITGDGAFLMSAQELSTIIEHKLDATLIILDNSGYGAERQIHPGKERSYNDFLPWKYEQLAETFGGEDGVTTSSYVAKTENDLDKIFTELRGKKGVNVVRVKLDPWDSASFNVKFSEALQH